MEGAKYYLLIWSPYVHMNFMFHSLTMWNVLVLKSSDFMIRCDSVCVKNYWEPQTISWIQGPEWFFHQNDVSVIYIIHRFHNDCSSSSVRRRLYYILEIQNLHFNVSPHKIVIDIYVQVNIRFAVVGTYYIVSRASLFTLFKEKSAYLCPSIHVSIN